jgi:hypothetical protein
MRFRIIGGYELVRGPGGSFSDYPQVLRPEAVQRFLWAKATGGPPYPAGSVPSDDGKLVCQLRSFLMRYRVGTVISTAAEAGREPIDTLYTQAMGPPSYVGGGATVWFRVGALLGARSPQCRS